MQVAQRQLLPSLGGQTMLVRRSPPGKSTAHRQRRRVTQASLAKPWEQAPGRLRPGRLQRPDRNAPSGSTPRRLVRSKPPAEAVDDYAAFNAALTHFHSCQASVGPGRRGLCHSQDKGLARTNIVQVSLVWFRNPGTPHGVHTVLGCRTSQFGFELDRYLLLHLVAHRCEA